MRSGFLKTVVVSGTLAATLIGSNGPKIVTSAATFPNDEKTIIHVLNRIGFGPRPGDVERVRAIGLQSYIDQQLHPERLADADMSARLAGLTTLNMSSREIAEQYEIPLMQARRQRQQAAGQNPDNSGNTRNNANPANPANPRRNPANPDRPAPPANPANLENPASPDPMMQRANGVLNELSEQKILRAAYSDRQLEAVLTDFWFNHFNVDARKGRDRFMLTEYERDVIRPHVLGRFRDLLGATAKSPAMLFYLDNWMSADPNGPHADPRQARRFTGQFGRGRFGQPGGSVVPPMPARPNAQQNMRRGLNENYGRELMELHTLGVDGGYTQKDVTEVARAFTGWTIRAPQMGAEYMFDPRFHDPGQKVVLGHVIAAGGGERDGEQVLDILARHPSTAHFIATSLVRRFVSDTPPASLVDRAADRFRATDGDLREVMRTILTSPEFLSPDAYRAKVKTPFEFVVSAVRASGADVRDATPLVRTMQQLGMPLYMCQPPTGYKDTADAWVNTGALVGRMNFAVQLSRQSAVDSRQSEVIIQSVLGGDISDTTRSTIARATTPEQMTALTLGSPEFQRR